MSVQADKMEELDNQLQSAPIQAKQWDLSHYVTSGMIQDIRALRAAETKAMYALIKELHLSVREFEIKGLPKPKDVKKSVIFIHSSHNSEVAQDFRA